MNAFWTSETGHKILAWSLLAFLLGGFIFLPQHEIGWPFHHWKLYTDVRDTLPETVTQYRLIVESDPPRIYTNSDLFTVDDSGSRQYLAERVMHLAVNGDGRQRPHYRSVILSQLRADGLTNVPVRFQECEVSIHYQRPFDPLTTRCTDLFTMDS